MADLVLPERVLDMGRQMAAVIAEYEPSSMVRVGWEEARVGSAVILKARVTINTNRYAVLSIDGAGWVVNYWSMLGETPPISLSRSQFSPGFVNLGGSEDLDESRGWATLTEAVARVAEVLLDTTKILQT